jgi:hypothetical protein
MKNETNKRVTFKSEKYDLSFKSVMFYESDWLMLWDGSQQLYTPTVWLSQLH